VKTSKASRDPDFERKIHDVLGLCVSPPDHAAAVSADGRRRCRRRGERGSRCRRRAGCPETRSRNCRRNGTACLTAALDAAPGKVTGQTAERRRLDAGTSATTAADASTDMEAFATVADGDALPAGELR